MNPELLKVAETLAALLKAHNRRIVFAESCTGGLISSALTTVPGISEFHCGSAVVYRIETKATWLGVDRSVLNNPGPVSAIVAEQMAAGVLKNTPEANCAGSITGHLGPAAPAHQDGLVFVGIARRLNEGTIQTTAVEHRLQKIEPEPVSEEAIREIRRSRQQEAATLGLNSLTSLLFTEKL